MVNVRRVLALAIGLPALLAAGCGDDANDHPPGPARPSYDQRGNLLAGSPVRADATDLVLVVLDGLRADALVSMPYLASLAREGVSFENAATSSPWSLPSLATLLTGLLPSGHLLIRDGAEPALPEAFTTFAEVLRNGHDYDTAAFVATRPPARGGSLFQGFERVAPAYVLAATEPLVASWSSDRRTARPFFLLLQTAEAVPASSPASPPSGEDALREYGEALRKVDADLEAAVGHLRALGLLENALLVVTATHGEAFGEHGMVGHGRALHDEVIHVPLVVSGPAPFRGGAAVRASVGTVDVLATYLDLVAAPALGRIEGRSFLGVLGGKQPGRPVLSEERLVPETTRGASDGLLLSVRSDRWKYLVTYDIRGGTVLEQAFDLAADPRETSDLAGGTGRIGTPPFDEAFCDAVETARDEIWTRVKGTSWLVSQGYVGGVPRVTSERPPRACPASPPGR
jgi:arylsulfatase A-like enzyme